MFSIVQSGFELYVSQLSLMLVRLKYAGIYIVCMHGVSSDLQAGILYNHSVRSNYGYWIAIDPSTQSTQIPGYWEYTYKRKGNYCASMLW